MARWKNSLPFRRPKLIGYMQRLLFLWLFRKYSCIVVTGKKKERYTLLGALSWYITRSKDCQNFCIKLKWEVTGWIKGQSKVHIRRLIIWDIAGHINRHKHFVLCPRILLFKDIFCLVIPSNKLYPKQSLRVSTSYKSGWSDLLGIF